MLRVTNLSVSVLERKPTAVDLFSSLLHNFAATCVGSLCPGNLNVPRYTEADAPFPRSEAGSS